MTQNYLPFVRWSERGEYPSKNTLYNWTRPGQTRDDMLRAGVIAHVNGRWLFNPEKWREYCERSAAA